LKEFLKYGEEVPGYDVRVLNEREARAGAGILFVGAFLGLVNCVMLNTAIFAEYFVTFFALDFTIRIIKPKYSPSLLMGRFFVQNQTPEYVGAEQKRFAWLIGVILAWPMFYYLVVDFQPTLLTIFVCMVCMVLLFLESAFSICVGCKIFNLIKREKATNCPGNVCEIKVKDPIQKFSPIQTTIVILTIIVMSYGTYLYMTKIKDRTRLVQEIKIMLMSEEELQALEDEEFQKEAEAFENSEDDF
jgi:hypothetical protein